MSEGTSALGPCAHVLTYLLTSINKSGLFIHLSGASFFLWEFYTCCCLCVWLLSSRNANSKKKLLPNKTNAEAVFLSAKLASCFSSTNKLLFAFTTAAPTNGERTATVRRCCQVKTGTPSCHQMCYCRGDENFPVTNTKN